MSDNDNEDPPKRVVLDLLQNISNILRVLEDCIISNSKFDIKNYKSTYSRLKHIKSELSDLNNLQSSFSENLSKIEKGVGNLLLALEKVMNNSQSENISSDLNLNVLNLKENIKLFTPLFKIKKLKPIRHEMLPHTKGGIKNRDLIEELDFYESDKKSKPKK